MMWLPWKPHGDDEAGLKLGPLKPGQARGTRRLVPWWVRAMRRAKAAGICAAAAEDQQQRRRAQRRRGRQRPEFMDGAAWSRRHSGAIGITAAGSGTRAIWRANRRSASSSAARALTRTRRTSIWRQWCGSGSAATRLMWSLIISPEDAERLDLRQHARDFVAGMEQDLGTQLEWVAIDHHNTDDEHIHLLIRGVRDDGRR